MRWACGLRGPLRSHPILLQSLVEYSQDVILGWVDNLRLRL